MVCTKQTISFFKGSGFIFITMKENNTLDLSHGVCFQMLGFETSHSKSEVSKSNSWKITSFSKTQSIHNVLYYQPLLITRYQVRIYANNLF